MECSVRPFFIIKRVRWFGNFRFRSLLEQFFHEILTIEFLRSFCAPNSLTTSNERVQSTCSFRVMQNKLILLLCVRTARLRPTKKRPATKVQPLLYTSSFSSFYNQFVRLLHLALSLDSVLAAQPARNFLLHNKCSFCLVKIQGLSY